MDTVQIKPEHLQRAIQARDDEGHGVYYSQNCVVALALRDKFNMVVSSGWTTFRAGEDEYIFEDVDKSIKLVQAFDDKEYDKVAAMLPLELKYKRFEVPA